MWKSREASHGARPFGTLFEPLTISAQTDALNHADPARPSDFVFTSSFTFMALKNSVVYSFMNSLIKGITPFVQHCFATFRLSRCMISGMMRSVPIIRLGHSCL